MNRSRPALDGKISIEDFTSFYWLKEELVSFCKIKGILQTGSKIDLASRIHIFLDCVEIVVLDANKQHKPTSVFDWKKSTLTQNTIITDNYKNTESVRAFFTLHIGTSFRFFVAFMNWMNQNTGKTLYDAIIEWYRLHALKKDKTIQTEIGSQFEYNQYMRDFLKDNPDKSSKEAMKYWKLKRALRGTNAYEKSDLTLSQIDLQQ
ncbi:MAG: hypothetical protein H7282_02185 [Cytophagaceae bacterium]|nr:hypothetical protein [Cytophagaceae bacterium]